MTAEAALAPARAGQAYAERPSTTGGPETGVRAAMTCSQYYHYVLAQTGDVQAAREAFRWCANY
jgi:hypothetical protein